MLLKLNVRGSLVALALVCVVGVLLLISSYSVENRGQGSTIKQVDCLPVETAFFLGERIHVLCVDPPKARFLEPYRYFALSTQDSEVDMIFGLLQKALETKQGIKINYDDNAAANPPGCLARDCRKITGIVLSPLPSR